MCTYRSNSSPNHVTWVCYSLRNSTYYNFLIHFTRKSKFQFLVTLTLLTSHKATNWTNAKMKAPEYSYSDASRQLSQKHCHTWMDSKLKIG